MTHIQKERSRASFSSDKLAELFLTIDGKNCLERFLKTQDTIINDPVLRYDPAELSLSRKELQHLLYKKAARIHELFNINDPWYLNFSSLVPHQLPLYVHNIMFIPTIANLATEEQAKSILEQVYKLNIVGCYAQTELGHGSDVQSLETTATYDVKTKEFILNSPTVSSTKWWPGELGCGANYAVTHAQLIINGKGYGVQTFLVQLRDLETHEPLKGITVGDIGPKLGYNTKDNGFLRFDNVRIPRTNMLMKYAKVSESGEYSKPSNDKIGYATMMYVRCKIIEGSYSHLGAALAIATKYSVFRKQFKDSNGEERVILDYQLQQNKLIPLIAATYAMNAASKKIYSMYNDMMTRIKKYEDFSMMKDLHAHLSGCKSFYTWECYQGIEVCRQSCGGHGFSSYSGLPMHLIEYAANVTLEGDNTIMALQTARYLIQCLGKTIKGGKMMGSVEYLRNVQELVSIQRCSAADKSYFNSFENVDRALQANSANLLWSVNKRLVKEEQNGVEMKDVWDNKIGIQLLEASRAHISVFTFKSFVEMINTSVEDEGLKKVLTKLCLLFGIQKLLEFPLGLARSGYFLPRHFDFLIEMKEDLLEEIRPDAIALIDGFSFRDEILCSALVAPDGKVYETLYEWATTKNPINTGKPNEGFMKHIKPVMGKFLYKPNL